MIKPTLLRSKPPWPGVQCHQEPRVYQVPEATPVQPEGTESREVLRFSRQYGPSYRGLSFFLETTPGTGKSGLSPEVCTQPRAALGDQGEEGSPRGPTAGEPGYPISENQRHLWRLLDRRHHLPRGPSTSMRPAGANTPTMLIDPPLTLSKPISFSYFDAPAVHFPHNNALIVTMIIGNCQVSKLLVGGGSVNILYEGALDRMKDTLRNRPSDDQSSNPISPIWV